MDAFDEIIDAAVEHQKVTSQLQTKLSEVEERVKNLEAYVEQHGSDTPQLSSDQKSRLHSVGLLKVTSE
jgi:uncharacterized coiled-coil protein SlyX